MFFLQRCGTLQCMHLYLQKLFAVSETFLYRAYYQTIPEKITPFKNVGNHSPDATETEKQKLSVPSYHGWITLLGQS